MIVRLNTSIPMLKLYIWLGIWRCEGRRRLDMLTVINAYYGDYGILQVCQILH